MIDFSQLDKVIHERGRLSIMSLLAARAEWSFQELKSELKMSDGNLITHLRTLQEAGYLEMEKEGRVTTCRLTKAGRKAFDGYVAVLAQVVQQHKG